MNETCFRENGAQCYFHPKEILVGVCALCLNERLLILAAKQGLKRNSSNKLPSSYYKKNGFYNKSKPSIFLPKIFTLGSLLGRRDTRQRRWKSGRHDFIDFADDPDTTSTSLEEDESFISIKFGDNGVASWDKSTTNTASKEHSTMSWADQTLVKHGTTKGSCDNSNNNNNDNNNSNNNKCVVEHATPRGSLRWRNRIGQLLQVIKWKRSNAGGNNSNKGEGMKVGRNNRGWIRTLRSRTKE